MPVIYLGDEDGYGEFDARRARDEAEAQIRAEVAAGLQAIRDANARLDAVITAAGPIETYDPGTKTAVQVLADVVPAVRQLATGVRLLAQGEKLALADVDYLARLQLGLVDLTGGPGPINPG